MSLSLTLAAALLPVLQQDPPKEEAKGPPPPMPVPTLVAPLRGDRVITIDGSLLEWPDLPPLGLDDVRQLSGTSLGAWHSAKDAGALAFLLWDDQHLYFAARVQDDWHRALEPEHMQVSEIPVADSLVLTFDPERDRGGMGPDRRRRDDREYWLAETPAHELVHISSLRGTAGVVDGGKVVVLHDKQQGMTTYEACIPWSHILPIGRQPKKEMVFGLQVVLNDYDESTDPLPQTRIGWTFGCGTQVDPSLFGQVMLVADLKEKVPPFPPLPEVPSDLPTDEQWADLATRLLARGPALYDGRLPPQAVGGMTRGAVLDELEDHVDRMPRHDWLALNMRIARRQMRESAGISGSGLPLLWNMQLVALSKQAEEPPPSGRFRIFRLPMGGWLVRSTGRNFMVDANGADIAHWLWGGMEFAILTQPMDFTRRNDQMLVRMAADKPSRPMLTHMAFHLPATTMNNMNLVEPGQRYDQHSGVTVDALGSTGPDGMVTYACGYRVTLADGAVMVFAGPTLLPLELPDGRIDLLVLTPRNPACVRLAERAKAGLILIDDVFLPQAFPHVPRVKLRHAQMLQEALLPMRSLILAPGEHWDVARG